MAIMSLYPSEEYPSRSLKSSNSKISASTAKHEGGEFRTSWYTGSWTHGFGAVLPLPERPVDGFSDLEYRHDSLL